MLGWHDAAHAETDTEGTMVIAPLTCSLVEKTDAIELRNNTLIAKAYGKPEIVEGYHCNYGVSPNLHGSWRAAKCASPAGTSRVKFAPLNY